MRKAAFVSCICLLCLLLQGCGAGDATLPEATAPATETLPDEPAGGGGAGGELPVATQGEAFSYRGDWENDTTDYKLVITRATCTFTSTNEGAMSNSSYTQEEDGLALAGDEWVRPTADGGLMADGYAGTFYRVGEGKGAQSPFLPYIGAWYNETAELSLQIQEGAFAMAEGMGFSGGGCSVEEDGSLSLSDAIATLNEDGTLTLSGVEGVFVKQEETTAEEE